MKYFSGVSTNNCRCLILDNIFGKVNATKYGPKIGLKEQRANLRVHHINVFGRVLVSMFWESSRQCALIKTIKRI